MFHVVTVLWCFLQKNAVTLACCFLQANNVGVIFLKNKIMKDIFSRFLHLCILYLHKFGYSIQIVVPGGIRPLVHVKGGDRKGLHFYQFFYLISRVS